MSMLQMTLMKSKLSSKAVLPYGTSSRKRERERERERERDRERQRETETETETETDRQTDRQTEKCAPIASGRMHSDKSRKLFMCF